MINTNAIDFLNKSLINLYAKKDFSAVNTISRCNEQWLKYDYPQGLYSTLELFIDAELLASELFTSNLQTEIEETVHLLQQELGATA